MPIPTRPATDDDMFFEYGGTPAQVLVSFYYGLRLGGWNGSGWRRPRKIRGKWTINRWGKRALLVRTDRRSKYPDFIAST